MKYRIIDPYKRALVKQLFDVETFELLAGDLRDVSITLQCGGDSASQCIPLEPVREFADGWHRYPEEKPGKTRKYIVAIDYEDERDVDVMTWCEDHFSPVDEAVIAWQEFPKIWKETDK